MLDDSALPPIQNGGEEGDFQLAGEVLHSEHLLIEILAHCPLRTVLSMSRVCRGWRDVIRSLPDDTWRSIVASELGPHGILLQDARLSCLFPCERTELSEHLMEVLRQRQLHRAHSTHPLQNCGITAQDCVIDKNMYAATIFRAARLAQELYVSATAAMLGRDSPSFSDSSESSDDAPLPQARLDLRSLLSDERGGDSSAPRPWETAGPSRPSSSVIEANTPADSDDEAICDFLMDRAMQQTSEGRKWSVGTLAGVVLSWIQHETRSVALETWLRDWSRRLKDAADSAVSYPLRLEARLCSTVEAISHWDLLIEERRACDGSLVRSELITVSGDPKCFPQSVWLAFEPPRWLTGARSPKGKRPALAVCGGVAEAEGSEGRVGESGLRGRRSGGGGGMGMGIADDGGGEGGGEEESSVRVVVRAHWQGIVMPVLDCVDFAWPQLLQNDMDLMGLSHTSGLYPWLDDDPGALLAPLTAERGASEPKPTLEATSRRATPRMMAYMHHELILPRSRVPVPQTLREVPSRVVGACLDPSKYLGETMVVLVMDVATVEGVWMGRLEAPLSVISSGRTEQGQNMLWAGDWDDGDDMGAPAHGGHGGAGDADPDAGPGAGNHHGGVGGANHHGGAWGANHHGGVGDAPGGGGHGGGPGAGGGGGGNEGERTVDLEARNEDVGLEDMVVVAPKGDGARVELNATWAHAPPTFARPLGSPVKLVPGWTKEACGERWESTKKGEEIYEALLSAALSEAMVDLSLFDTNGHMLCGRSGVELWMSGSGALSIRFLSSMDHDYGSDSGKVNLQLSKIDGAEGPKLEIKLTMTRQALRDMQREREMMLKSRPQWLGPAGEGPSSMT